MMISKRKLLIKSIFPASIISLVPLALTLLQIKNPFILHFRFVKLLIFSLTMFMPSNFEILLGFMKIRFNEIEFLVFTYIFFLVLISIILFYYFISKKKRRFTHKLFAWLIIYVVLSMFYLW